MNDILSNAAIAFAVLSVFIIPLYIALKTSGKKKIIALKKICSELANREGLTILREKYIGDKVFAFTETGQVLIVVLRGQEEQTYILDNKSVDYILVAEKFEGNRVAEIKLNYRVSGLHLDIPLYKEHRENAAEISELRKIANEIKQFLGQ